MGTLDGQVALITGCGRLKGLGRAIALAFTRAGALVAVTDIAPGGTRNSLETGEAEVAAGWKGLDSLVEEIEGLGGRALPLLGDVGVKDDAERMVAEAIDHFGQIDILVNNAGAPLGPSRGWTWEVPEEAWDTEFRVNIKGPFLMSSAVARHLLERKVPGRIINMSSGAGLRGVAQRAAYCASKFAVIGLTQSMAQELAKEGITVNAVCPGAVATARTDASQARAAQSTKNVPAPPSPVGRVATTDDIVRGVMYLAEPAADFITGETLNISGGLLM